MRNSNFIFCFLFATSLSTACLVQAEEQEIKAPKTMAIFLEGAYSLVPFAGGGYGGGLRFEYAFSRFMSLFVPVEYRFLAMSGFAESSKFTIGTAEVGAKFYFSQLFWHQEFMQGLFIEGKLGAGYAHQKSDLPHNYDNKGTTFVLGAAFGYAYAFDFGLAVGASLGMAARSYLLPIKAPWIAVHPVPELALSIGWVF